MKPDPEEHEPHSPDVLERETADDGFSAGWGLHHLPAETYIIDCHTHMCGVQDPDAVQRAVDQYHAGADDTRLRRHVALDGRPQNFKSYATVSARDDRFLWMIWPHHHNADVAFLREAAEHPGFCGIKLHNAPLIMEADSPDIWRSPAWDDMFEACAEVGKPVLWHVTQRVTASPYTLGGREAYWRIGRAKGATYGNRDLLAVFEDVLARHRGTQVIGAHQLHVGPESLDTLLAAHPNLSVDLSVGAIVRTGDEMYEADRQRWRLQFIKHQDRLLFGTDNMLGNTWPRAEMLAAHCRFIRQLRLPQAVLEKIMHANYERLAGLSPVPTSFCRLQGFHWPSRPDAS